MFTDIDNVTNVCIQNSIKIGIELITKQTKIPIIVANEEKKQETDDINKQFNVLSDELRFGDDTIEDSFNLNVNQTNIHHQYVCNANNINDKDKFRRYIMDSYKLTHFT